MLLIYSTKNTARLEYTLKLLFETVSEIDYQFTSDKTEFEQAVCPKLNYSEEQFKTELSLKPHTLLFEEDIKTQEIDKIEYSGLKCFFPTEGSCLPFDVFAASFFVASRYEEYLQANRDKHGRFPAIESILFKDGLLKKPVVHLWINFLLEKIRENYPEFEIPKKKFRFLMTSDIDSAWAYKNKGFFIQAGAIAKSLLKADFSGIKKRINVLSGKENDPYDTFQFIQETFIKKPQNLQFFALLGNRNKYDKNISHKNRNLQKLIRELAKKHPIGIHPSYSSTSNKNKLFEEKDRLAKILNTKVEASRQHYLLLDLPQTYRQLTEAGISSDYTMGYADQIGFRAGLCTAFPFFDLKENKASGLTVYPLHVMEVTLNEYMNLTPDKALEETESIMEEVKNVGGTFIGLWHNESLTDSGAWAGWKQVFSETVKKGFEFENE